MSVLSSVVHLFLYSLFEYDDDDDDAKSIKISK